MPKISSVDTARSAAGHHPRVPAEFLGIQVNFCKSPRCANYALAVAPTSKRGSTGSYAIVSAGNGTRLARCNACGERAPLKSNLGIGEELQRIRAEGRPGRSCPDAACSNHAVPLDHAGAYHSFGKTPIGSQRHRCLACGKTFTVKPSGVNPIARQRQSDKNPVILRLLCGKMPLRRICEAADIAAPVLYQRIDFLHRQACAFLAHREEKLLELDPRRLYVGVDRQDHVVNWAARKDRRNVVLSAVASADNASGYVFGMHVNFDADCDPAVIEAAAASLGDASLPIPHRRFARLWVQAAFDAALKRSVGRSAGAGLGGEIAAAYAASGARADVESPEAIESADRLPQAGMLVHAEYTLYAHFLRLRELLGDTGKVRFFLDQDSGMRAACLAAWADRVKARTCDAFYVRVNKGLTIDEKRRRLREAGRSFREQAAKHPGESEAAVKLLLLKRRIAAARAIGQWRDRWVLHPLPSMAEPEKAMCYLTDYEDYDPDHLAWLYNKASLHAVDSWFNRLRRRSSILERSVSSRGNRGRLWNGYSAYRPGQLQKLMTIYRACHNYIWLADGQKRTPAMRLGLARAPLDYKELVYFR